MSLIFLRNDRGWWKPFVVIPCLVAAVGISLLQRFFIPNPVGLREAIQAFASFFWFYAPFVALYTMVVGVIFVRRKEPGWTALAFLSLGLMIPETETVAVLWLRWLLFPNSL